jgi:hydrogenase nickel incorporation protein HypB
MCDTCGCEQGSDGVTIRRAGSEETTSVDGNAVTAHEHSHTHSHGSHAHDHPHTHDHPQEQTHARVLEIGASVLQQNNLIAARNRGYFEGRGIIAINLVSSPGSGKTSLLERTVRELQGTCPIAVIEGDQQTMRDAERILAAGAPAVQVNTGNGCHLDAGMVQQALQQLSPEPEMLLLIENVGNLVCPALFDLGETARVVIMSVTEGEDKPLKYPTMFRSAQLCIINKVDLLPHLDFDLAEAKSNALQVNPSLVFIDVSARTGEGLPNWYQWLHALRPTTDS